MRVGGRRLLAVLAGGVVLVGGGITTLAAWQDQTYVRAPLTLTSFNVQQTLDGSGNGLWAEADTDTTPSTLLLTLSSGAVALSPDNVAAGWVGLRADAGSVSGKVKLEGAVIGTDTKAVAPQLRYEAAAGVSETACRNLTAFSTITDAVVLATPGSTLTAATGTVFPLAAGSSGQAGQMVGVCIRTSLLPGTSRVFSGATLSPTWRFSATSDS